MKIHLSCLCLVSLLLVFAVKIYPQQKQVQASFCKLSLSESIKQANATFSNIYFVRIGKDNKPVLIKKLTGFDFIKDAEVSDCVNGWAFENFEENSSVTVTIRWVHGYGWEPMRITSKDYALTIQAVAKPSAIKVVEFGRMSKPTAVRKINAFWKRFEEGNIPAYIINYGSAREMGIREKWIRDTMGNLGYHYPARITMVRGGGKVPRTVMWLIPEDADVPVP